MKKLTETKPFRRILSGVLSAACVLSGTAFAGATVMTQQSAPEVSAASTSAQPAFSWDNATVYFLLTDRFCNGDTSNDNAYGRMKTVSGDNRATFHGGDFAGITKKINEGYFDDLGVNAIWLTAPYEQLHGYILGDGFAHYSYHGYYVTDYTEPDAAYGTRQEFQTLVDTAHEHGIRIVMDIVLNHAGYNNMIDMNEYNYGTLLDGWKQVYDAGDIANYHKKIDYKSSASDWGRWWGPDWIRSGLPGYNEQGDGPSEQVQCLTGLPDFRTESTKQVGIPQFLQTKWQKEGTLNEKMSKYGSSNTVTGYISTWLAEWVSTYGVDGFRCDTAKHVEFGSWKQLKDKCVAALKQWRQNNPNKAGANWTDDFWMTGECWDHGVGWGYDGYFTQGGFDSMINFETQGGGLISEGKVASTYQNYAAAINSNDKFNALSYISSHDTVLARGDQYHLGSALLLLPGGVQIYYGDETCRPLVPGVAVSGDGHAVRSDMNWDSINQDVLAHWQKVGTFRNNHLSVGAGQNVQLTASAGTAFGRTYSKGGVSDKIAAVIDAGANVSVTVQVGDLWPNGTALENAYDGTSAVVSGGSVTFNSGAHGTILIQEPDGTKGRVNVKHIDKSTGKEIKTEVLSGIVGNSYQTEALTITGYTVASISGSTSGTFSENEVTVTYYYTFDSQNYAYLVTKYVDAATGEELADSETTVGRIGSAYSVSPKDIKNYECDESQTSNATGTYKSGTTTVTFKYSYVEPSNLRVHYYNANNWSTVSLYAYHEVGDNVTNYLGNWPGKTMTAEGDGWFYCEVPDVESATIIFNDGKMQNGSQEPAGTNTPGYEASGEVWYKDRKPLSAGKVNVKYITDDGKTLGSATLTGIADGTTTYTTQAKTFTGYELKTTPSNATGLFTAATITVTYVYKSTTPVSELVNNSSLVSETVNVGTAITVKGAATGGTAPYTYTFQYKRSTSDTWNTFGSGNTGSFTPSAEGTFNIRAYVKDSTGKSVVKSLTAKAVATASNLVNNSTVNNSSSSAEVAVGSPVTIKGAASGGKAPYTFSYQYKRTTTDTWTSLGTGASKSFTPSAAGTFNIRAYVKDSTGKTVVKSLSAKAVASTSTLVNNSTVPSQFTLGTAVTIKGAASGGTAPYTFSYQYKRTTSDTWSSLPSGATASFKPGAAGTFNIRVYVKDKTGKTVVKSLATTAVANNITNNSTVSATSFKVGQAITLQGKASGGTGSYTFTYQYKRSSASSFSTISTTSSMVSFKPSSAGTFVIRIIAKDSAGKSATKDINVTCSSNSTLVNNSTVSKTSFNVGETITVKGAASGGTGSISYTIQYKRSTASSYSTGSSSGTFSFKPGSAGTFNIRVIAKDGSGATAVKDFTVVANASTSTGLTNSSTISQTSITKGSTVTLKGVASGGKSPYYYSYYYKLSTVSTWSILGSEMTLTASQNFTPTAAGTYNIKISVMDSTGETVSKEYTLKVS